MRIIESPEDIHRFIKEKKRHSMQIGLVPTMGALHRGHISLFETSVRENDLTVGSIFVNPIQFNNNQDLDLYPRTIEADLKVLESIGCEVVFLPSPEAMYSIKPQVRINFGPLEDKMEGSHRPGHFNGVGIVVAKLFNLIMPDKAYFGQKDLQQYLIIKQLVNDFSFSVNLTCCPIVREADGLAMSSRNVRLTPQNRPLAAQLYKALQLGAEQLTKGVEKAKSEVRNFLSDTKQIQLEYFEIVDSETLQEVNNVNFSKGIALCIAANLDNIRLIDNLIIIS